MKRLPHVAILMVAVALVAADKGEEKKGDAEAIQGKWALTTAMDSGGDQVKGIEHFKLIVTAKHFRLEFRDKVLEKFAYKLDASKQPKWIDVAEISDGEVKDPALGIYELKGDTVSPRKPFCEQEVTMNPSILRLHHHRDVRMPQATKPRVTASYSPQSIINSIIEAWSASGSTRQKLVPSWK